jgi:hypothetical protein
VARAKGSRRRTEQAARRRSNQLTVEKAEAEVGAALDNTTFGALLSRWLVAGSHYPVAGTGVDTVCF